MEQSRLLIAIVLSLAIFLAWQFFFSPDEAERRQAKKVESPAVEEKQAVKDTEKPYKEAIEKPTIGMMLYWATMPIITPFGIFITPVKSFTLI